MDRIRGLVGSLAPAMQSVASTLRTAGIVVLAAGLFIGATLIRPTAGRVIIGLIVALVLALPGLVLWDFSRLLSDVVTLPRRAAAGSTEAVGQAIEAASSMRGVTRGSFWSRLRSVLTGLLDVRRVAGRVQDLGVFDLGRLVSPVYLAAVVASLIAGAFVVALAVIVSLLIVM